MSYHLHHTRGFLLRSFDAGESNRQLLVFTEEFGLLRVSAQSVRKQASKLRPFLSELSFLRITLVHGKNCWRLTDASGIASFGIKNSREKTRLIASLFTLVSRFVQGEGANGSLFSILEDGYSFLFREDVSPRQMLVLETLFAWKICAALGYAGEKSTLAMFAEKTFSKETIEEFSPYRAAALAEVNRALAESHL